MIHVHLCVHSVSDEHTVAINAANQRVQEHEEKVENISGLAEL